VDRFRLRADLGRLLLDFRGASVDGGSEFFCLLRPLIDQLKARGFSFSTPVDEPPAI